MGAENRKEIIMREIKFRGYHHKLKQYFKKGFKIGDADDLTYGKNITWEQFTGIKDNQDIEIYEGDFVIHDDGDDSLYLISWNEENLCWWVWDQSDSHGDKGDFGFPLAELNGDYLDVVGNECEGLDKNKIEKLKNEPRD